MSTPVEDRLAEARAWIRQDPDAETRDELSGIVTRAASGDVAALADLDDRFGARLAFGTAGLRGELGAGSNRMNRVLVAQAAAGFAAYLSERATNKAPTVIVGYDGRKNSRRFAEDSAEIFAGAGLNAILLPRLLPTPVLAFAVRHFGADAGVMVTASHNPPNDNGYKVYLGGENQGSQIVAPADSEIAAAISAVANAGDIAILPRSTAYQTADEAVVEAYIAATAAVAPAPSGAGSLRWVYTAMHGVGWETVERIVRAAGYPRPYLVEAQTAPDATFRTVSFPNPEEPGAMDLSFARARQVNASFILANDPDADRLAVAIPDGTGGWRRLTGNEIGLLLGARAARAASATGTGGSLACSLVSSPGLGVIAKQHGLDFHETLTGFKWISRAPDIRFGFEEALGYLVNPETVRDKDGISAAVAVLGLAAEAAERGETIGDLLEGIGRDYGHFASGQVSVRVEDLSLIATVMSTLRQSPPSQIGEDPISSAEDLLQAAQGAPAGDVLRYRLGSGSRVIVRPSGTEPKLKVYIDARGDSPEDAQQRVTDLEAGVRTLLDAISAS